MIHQAESERATSATISDLTVKAAIAELPEQLLIEIVMELTSGFHHPDLVRDNIMKWKAGARRKRAS